MPMRHRPRSFPSFRAARKEDDNSSEEEQYERRKRRPHANRINGMRPTPVLVNMILDDAKDYKINDHNHQRNEPRQDSDECSK